MTVRSTKASRTRHDSSTSQRRLIERDKLRALHDDVVRAVDLGDAAPFVFLNACQVGNGNQVLGSYAGMAEAFLQAGASAVIARYGRSTMRSPGISR